MPKNREKHITTLLSEFFDAADFTDSFFGKIAKELLLKSLANYMDANNNFGTKNTVGNFGKLYQKWYRRIFADLSKTQINEDNKKMLLALFVASLVARVISDEPIASNAEVNEIPIDIKE